MFSLFLFAYLQTAHFSGHHQKMKITHCKLSKSTQKKLLQFFVLEVTARTAADILSIQPNSAMLFYRKIRQVIAYHLEL